MQRHELSPVMVAAQKRAAAHGGELVRFPGGFWLGAGETFARGNHFGTPTVNGLLSRGVATVIEWQEGRGGRFPIRVRVDS